MIGRNRKTILLVEQEAQAFAVENRVLEKWGYRVVEASSWEDALRLVTKTPEIDLVLMDIQLGPGIDGTEMNLKERDIPLLFLVNRNDTEILERTDRIASYGYAVRDCGEAVLNTSIRTALELHEALTGARESEKALLKSEENLAALINATPDIICFKDGEGRWIKANESILGLYRLGHIAYQGKTEYEMADLTLPMYRDAFRTCSDTDALAWEKGGPSRSEEIIPDAAGTQRVFDVIKIPLYHRDGSRRGLVVFGRDITDFKRTQRKLEENENWVQTILSSLFTGVVVIDAETHAIVDANDRAAKLCGVPKEDMVGHICHKFICPAQAGQCPVTDLGQTVDTSERSLITGQGQSIPVYKTVARASMGGKDYLIESFIDISERKEAENRLLQSMADLERHARFLDALLDAIPTPVFFKDVEGRYLGCNRAFSEQMGVTADRIRGRMVHECWPSEQARIYHQKDLELMGDPHHQQYEFVVRDKEGNDRDVVFAKDVFRDELGQVAGIVGAYIDITEQNRAVEALRAAEEKYRILVENAGEAIFVAQAGRLMFANRKTSEVLGYSREDLMSVPFTEFVHPEDREMISARHMARLKGEQPLPSYPFRVLDREGNTLWVRLNTVLVEWEGKPATLSFVTDINELMAAEKALRESERFLEESHRIARLGGWKANPHTDYLEWTKGVYDIIGASYDYKPGLNEGLRVFPPEYLPLIKQKLAECLETGNPFQIDLEAVTTRGDRLWTEIRGLAPVVEGARSYVIGTFQDITYRKRAEEALKLNESRLEALLRLNQMTEASLSEIASFSLEEAVRLTQSSIGYVAFTNHDETVLTMHAWSASAMKECRIQEKPIEYLVASTGLWGEAVRQRRPIITNDYAAASPWKKGTPKGHVAVQRHMNVPVFDGDRIVIVAGVGNKETEYDETDVRQLTLMMSGMWQMIQRRRANELLHAEREKLHTLSENAPYGMVLIDEKGSFTYLNKKFIDMFGYDLSDVPDGRTWFRKAYREPRYRHEVIGTWLRDLEEFKEGQAFGVRKTWIFNVTCKNGSQKMVRFVPVRITSGEHLMTCEDVTEMKKLETQLHQAQKMEAIGTLAGGVAHDFNNILMVITGYGTLLQARLDRKDPLRVYVDQILAGSQKAADLTRSLLAFSRQQSISLVPLNVNAAILSTEQLLKRLLTEDIKVEITLTPERAVAMADATQIDQILFNLATNARDAMPDGGSLAIRTERIIVDNEFAESHGFGGPGEYLLIAVSDTGHGMDEKTREHIFDPFFTTKEAGKGTGMGLATVYGIVKQHNGHILVESEPGRGCAFSIYLPAVSAPVEEGGTTILEAERGSETLLIAEDNEAVRILMRDIVMKHGYRVIEAVDGQDAVEKARQAKELDFLILDSVMPRMNGREAFEEIGTFRPGIKALFISGYTRDIVLRKGIEDRAFNFISKPLSPGQLLRKIRELLDG